MAQFWFTLGLAGSTVSSDSVTRHDVQARPGGSAAENLSDWAASGGRIPVPKQVIDVATEVYPSAFAWAMVILGAVCLVGGVLAVVLMPRRATAPATGAPHG